LKLRRFFPKCGPVLPIQQPYTGCPPVLPGQMYPAQVLPAQYSPTKQSVQFNQQDVYVPVVHPCHTTQVNQTNYKYVHYFPHNKSVVNQATQQNVYGSPPVPPSPYPYY
jgi:hypothetical protein